MTKEQYNYIKQMPMSLIEDILSFYIKNNWFNKEFALLLQEKLDRNEIYA